MSSTRIRRADLRKRVAQEAAELLYTGQEKEYKQAKMRGAKNVGFSILPSNFEIAFELNRIADEREGESKQERIVQMRCEALHIMQAIAAYSPILVGSVWRGTAHRNSDIDVKAYALNPQEIVRILEESNYTILKTETQAATKEGRKKGSFHIYLNLPKNFLGEIAVHTLADANVESRCEIYGDNVTGLTIKQLRQVLRKHPIRKFVPT